MKQLCNKQDLVGAIRSQVPDSYYSNLERHTITAVRNILGLIEQFPAISVPDEFNGMPGSRLGNSSPFDLKYDAPKVQDIIFTLRYCTDARNTCGTECQYFDRKGCKDDLMTSAASTLEALLLERESQTPALMNTHVGLRTEYETPHSCGNCGEHIAVEWPFCPECGTATGLPVTGANPKPLTEKEIRARVGEIVTIVSQAAGGTVRTHKCVVDLYDYRDDHCFILWKYGIRASAGNRLSQFERNCLLLPFGELNYSWVAYDHLPAQYIHFPERFIQKEVRPTFWGEPNGGSK